MKEYHTDEFSLSDGDVIECGENVERVAIEATNHTTRAIVLSTGERREYVVLSNIISGETISMPDNTTHLTVMPSQGRVSARVWFLVDKEEYSQ